METLPENENDFFIIKHKKEIQYTTIYNDCINDEKLSAESLAILIYVMSKPENWKINIKNISNRYNIGRDKVRNSINNLREAGYMKRVRRRKKDGSLSDILVYASDKPIFLSTISPTNLQKDNEQTNKQPQPEIQAVVAAEKTDKQPRPEIPALVNQAVDSLYIQKKDFNKKTTTTNKAYGNKIDVRARTECLEEKTDLYPEPSVVVFFMKKIEGLDIAESTLVSWLRKHGGDYVEEKIRVLDENPKAANPSAFLCSAITYDWKEKKGGEGKSTTLNEARHKPETRGPIEIDDVKNWFRYLTKIEKLTYYDKASKMWSALDSLLSLNKISVLDENFVDGPWFKPMMVNVGIRF